MADTSWLVWALGSAMFAALTAILAKIGVANVSSDFAMLFRTAVVLLALLALLLSTGQLTLPIGVSTKTYLFLTLSGLATGASWLCYFRALKVGNASQVAPVDKLSVVLVAIIASLFLGEKLTGINWLGVALISAGVVFTAIR